MSHMLRQYKELGWLIPRRVLAVFTDKRNGTGKYRTVMLLDGHTHIIPVPAMGNANFRQELRKALEFKHLTFIVDFGWLHLPSIEAVYYDPKIRSDVILLRGQTHPVKVPKIAVDRLETVLAQHASRKEHQCP